MDLKLGIGILIFITTFYYIITEKYPRPLVSIIGGGSMVIFRILTEHEALKAVGNNLEILFLLMGLMMVVDIISESGIFQWFAIKVVQLANGEPKKILIGLSIVTAICSALLDNVTTILLIVPVAILIASQIKLDPFPFVMLQIFSANIGGAATMIGDPPNLIIASAGKLTFNEFILNLSPLVIINMVVLLISALMFYGKKMQVSQELRAVIMDMQPERMIKDRKLMKQSLSVFAIILVLFLTNTFTHFGLAIVAMLGAAVLLIISGKSPEHVFKKVEWETLFFFGGLFILVDGIESLGIMNVLSKYIITLTAGHRELTAQVILLVSTILAPILGATPFTLSFAKVVNQLVGEFASNTKFFWWALSLGACLGGNMMIIGASSNLVAISLAKKAGLDISFGKFFKFGIVVVQQSLVLSMIYIHFRY